MSFTFCGKPGQSKPISKTEIVTISGESHPTLAGDVRVSNARPALVEEGITASNVHPNAKLSCEFVKAHIAPQLKKRSYTVMDDHSVRVSLSRKADRLAPVLVDERQSFHLVNKIIENRYDHVKEGEASVLFHRAVLKKHSDFYGLCIELKDGKCQMRSRYYSPFGFTDRSSNKKDVQMFSRTKFDVNNRGEYLVFSMKISNKKIPMTCLKAQN